MSDRRANQLSPLPAPGGGATMAVRRVAATNGIGRFRTRPVGPPRSPEHVVFRYEHGSVPAITYYSLPHGCSGGADTLDAARKRYRAEMIRLFGAQLHQLPPVVEHLEAVVAGIWVRTDVGAVHRDAVGDRMFLQTLLANTPAWQSIRAEVQHPTRRGASPVVLIVEPADTVASVIDQMRSGDVVLIVHSDLHHVMRWAMIYGPDATGPADPRALPERMDIRTMSVELLTGPFSVQAPALRLPVGHVSVRAD